MEKRQASNGRDGFGTQVQKDSTMEAWLGFVLRVVANFLFMNGWKSDHFKMFLSIVAIPEWPEAL